MPSSRQVRVRVVRCVRSVTAAHTHADKRSRWADRQVGRAVGAPGRAQWMSSGPMLDARHAGQAGETGRQTRRARATEQHTHTCTYEAGRQAGR